MVPFRWLGWAWHVRGWAACFLFACAAGWGGAWAQAPLDDFSNSPFPIRRIDETRDGPAWRRIEVLRHALPAKYSRRHNFAWAVAQIDGLDKTEYFAHSGVDRKSELSSVAIRGIENISLRPKKGRFEVLCVNRGDEVEGEDCFPRYSDTEYKILEDMASRLPDPTARGRVRLYTDLPPCASCRHVMQQFLKAYPQVQLQVLYRGR